jgi:hypothetical protein
VQTKVPERAWASTRMNEEKTQVIFHRTIFYIIYIFTEILSNYAGNGWFSTSILTSVC